MIRVCLYTNNKRLLERYKNALENKYMVHSFKTIDELIANIEPEDLILLHAQYNQEILKRDLDIIYEITQKKNTLILREIPELYEGEVLLSHHIGGYANANLTDVVLLQALDLIANNNVWLYPELMTHIINKMNDITSHENLSDLLESLSPREQEVAKLISEGNSNKMISEELNISQSTVKLHVHSIFEKLHVKSRVALAILMNQKI